MKTGNRKSRAGFPALERVAVAASSLWKTAACAAFALLGAVRTDASVLATDPFPGPSQNGWVDRDPLEMTVSYNAGFGNGGGSLQGTFASQGVPAFESDAFRATSSSSSNQFSGNFYTTYGNFSDLAFHFYAEDLLPSTFILRIGNGVNTFFYNIAPQLTTVASWTTVNVSLAYSASWIGGTATQFSNLFSNVTFMDVQVGRNGTGAQDYYLDNFSLLYNSLEDLVMVPEPGSNGLLLIGALALIRSRLRRRKAPVA